MTETAIRCTCSSPVAACPGWPLAQGLLKAGHTVEVFERDADLNRKQGYYLHFNADRRRGAAPGAAGRPLRALPRDLARVLRPARVDRPRRPARRAQLAAAHGSAQRRARAAHRRAPPHAAPDPVRPARRPPARRARRSCPTTEDADGVTVTLADGTHRTRRRAGRRRRHPLRGAHPAAARGAGDPDRDPGHRRLRPHAAHAGARRSCCRTSSTRAC